MILIERFRDAFENFHLAELFSYLSQLNSLVQSGNKLLCIKQQLSQMMISEDKKGEKYQIACNDDESSNFLFSLLPRKRTSTHDIDFPLLARSLDFSSAVVRGNKAMSLYISTFGMLPKEISSILCSQFDVVKMAQSSRWNQIFSSIKNVCVCVVMFDKDNQMFTHSSRSSSDSDGDAPQNADIFALPM